MKTEAAAFVSFLVVSICAPPPSEAIPHGSRTEVYSSEDNAIAGHNSTVFLIEHEDGIRRIFFIKGAKGKGFFIWNFAKLLPSSSARP